MLPDSSTCMSCGDVDAREVTVLAKAVFCGQPALLDSWEVQT